MRLVVDTNVILRALIGGSMVLTVLLGPGNTFYVPEFAFEEIETHIGLIVEKSRLSERQVRTVLLSVSANLRVLPAREIEREWARAEGIMGSLDPKDVPFVAAALSARTDGIWSDDNDFKRQKAVRVWNTAEMLASFS